MNSNKYVALDVHSASIVAKVHNDAGKYVMESILETKARTVRNFMKGISGKVHVTFEEGTQAAWLYDLIKPMVAEVVVCEPRHNKLLGLAVSRIRSIRTNWPNYCDLDHCGPFIMGR